MRATAIHPPPPVLREGVGKGQRRAPARVAATAPGRQEPADVSVTARMNTIGRMPAQHRRRHPIYRSTMRSQMLPVITATGSLSSRSGIESIRMIPRLPLYLMQIKLPRFN
jgi:hypothetical protein